MSVGKFLAAIMPTLLELGRELFKSSGGDPVKARKMIRSRVGELRKGQAANDAKARKRFG